MRSDNPLFSFSKVFSFPPEQQHTQQGAQGGLDLAPFLLLGASGLGWPKDEEVGDPLVGKRVLGARRYCEDALAPWEE